MRLQIKAGRWLLLPIVTALAVAAVGCGGSTTSSTSHSPASSAAKPLKVALITPSATNDLAFSQAMYSAVESLKARYHLTISVQDNMFVVPDAANAIRQYATQGYNLIIANGSQYGSTVQQLAKQFPKVSFAWGTAGSTFGLKNVYAYQAASNQGGYVQGYMAGLLSKSKVIGVIGPIDVGDAQLYCDGFKAGALAADPHATVHLSFTGSFSDVSLMASAAKSYTSEGADVLTGSSQSVVGAIGVAKAKSVAWFGTQWDQSSLAPTSVVSSQAYNWAVVLSPILARIQAGKLGGATYVIKLSNGGEKIVFNSSYNLPAKVKSAGESVMSKIESGAIKPPQ
jgi:basic membrane lipoprotein Med (substrate-binding protein (PBP1-ABC) superfamily)